LYLSLFNIIFSNIFKFPFTKISFNIVTPDTFNEDNIVGTGLAAAAPRFYSHVNNIINEAPVKMTANEWKAYLKNKGATKEEIEAYWARVPKPQGQPKRQRRTVEEPPVDFYPSMGGGMFSDAEYNEISGESTYDDEFASAKTTLETTYNQRFDPENDSEITKSLFDL
jgi:hypothetical protein